MSVRSVSTIRAAGVAVLKRAPRLRAWYRAVRSWLSGLVFRWHSRGRLDPTLIVFESFVGRSYTGSPKALYEAMLDDPRFAGFRFAWVMRDPAHADGFPRLREERTVIVRYLSRDYYRAYGRAGTWVGNSILPAWITPRRGQRYVQTWHGTPLKRIGLDVVDKTQTALNAKSEIRARYIREGAKVSCFLSSSDFTTRAFTSAFALPTGPASPISVTGDPRNDPITAASPDSSAAARARLGIDADKKVLLYAPTWRDDQHVARSGYVYSNPLDIGALRRELGEGWVVLFRAHYLVTNSIDFDSHRGFVRNVSDIDDINELYLASDILVTDYSSAFFDFALLDRPMAFYCYDLEHYAQDLRGFYLSLDELPGPIVTTQAELVQALRDEMLGRDFAAKRAAINAAYNPHADSHVCERVLALILDPAGN